ncbi:MAG TPA: hypothetical protein VKU44_05970 [Terriglobia bacterium]|nr:hypothetical protein [Terriglobia bacterium]
MDEAARLLAVIGWLVVCLGSPATFQIAAQETAPEPPGVAPDHVPRESWRAAQTRALNNRLLLLHAQIQEATPAEAESLRTEAATVIGRRAAALSALIEENPRTALTFAFSPELLDALAKAFPDAKSMLESHGTWRGPVEVWIADYPKPAHSKTIVRMKVGGQWVDVHFAGKPPVVLLSGAVLQGTGVLAGRTLAVSTATAEASTTWDGRDEQ